MLKQRRFSQSIVSVWWRALVCVISGTDYRIRLRKNNASWQIFSFSPEPEGAKRRELSCTVRRCAQWQFREQCASRAPHRLAWWSHSQLGKKPIVTIVLSVIANRRVKRSAYPTSFSSRVIVAGWFCGCHPYWRTPFWLDRAASWCPPTS